MAEHEHFIKKMAAKTVVSIRHGLVTSSQKRRLENVRRRSTVAAAPSSASSRKSTSEKNGDRMEPTVTGLRFEFCVIKGKRKKVHRVFVMCNDSMMYSRVGWVVNDDVDTCMVCHQPFYEKMTTGKHHCRACGNIVCNPCSTGRAVVAEAESIGPARVCNQCYFGQEVVDAYMNDICGDTYAEIGALGNGVDDIICDDPDEVEITLNLWSYGPMVLGEIHPVFVIRTRRSTRERVYINVCKCDLVPFNEHITVAEKRIIHIVCGSMGRTPDGYVVYDVALNPKEVELMESEGIDAKSEICEQSLVCVSTLTSEKDFYSYQWETDVTYKERMLNTKMAAAALAEAGEMEASDSENASRWMAVPSAAAFRELLQCCTKLKDLAQGENGEPTQTAMMNKEQAKMHRDRLERKLAGRKDRVEDLTTEEAWRQQHSLQLTPFPGFVIKTRKRGDHLKKVFVNVYHHETVDSFVNELLSQGIVLARDEPHVLFGDSSDVSDKEGVVSLLYHVVVDSKYFLESFLQSSFKITDDYCIQKILEKLNVRFQDDLEEDHFVLPRVKGGFKGEWIANNMHFGAHCDQPARTKRGSILTPVPESTDAHPHDPETSLATFQSPFEHSFPDRYSVAPRDTDSIVSDITTATDFTGFSMTRKSIADLFYVPKQRPSLSAGGAAGSTGNNSRTPSVSSNAPAPSSSSASAAYASGREMITADMLELNRSLNLDLRGALQLKQLSVTSPLVLTGWQVTLFDKNNKSDVYVVTGARKNHLRKVEYRLSNLEKGDLWVRLRRSEKKTGVPFTINRRVLVLPPSAQIH